MEDQGVKCDRWAAVNEAENGKDWKEKKRSKDVGRNGGIKHNWQEQKRIKALVSDFGVLKWSLIYGLKLKLGLKLDEGNGEHFWRDFFFPWQTSHELEEDEQWC